MSLLLTDEKQTHLSHVILNFLQQASEVTLAGEATQVLREIKKIIAGEMALEVEIVKCVNVRLQSYSRKIPEGSAEWDVLFQKTYAEELRKRNLGS